MVEREALLREEFLDNEYEVIAYNGSKEISLIQTTIPDEAYQVFNKVKNIYPEVILYQDESMIDRHFRGKYVPKEKKYYEVLMNKNGRSSTIQLKAASREHVAVIVRKNYNNPKILSIVEV